MEYWQRLGLVRTERCSYLIGRYVSQVLSCPKCHPQLLDLDLGCYFQTKTTTSVFTVLKRFFWKPTLTASAWYRIIWVSASWWLQRARWVVCHGELHRTSKPFVATTCLLVTMCVMCLAKKANNSTSFASIHRNCCQFPGRLVDASTLPLMPFPHVLLVWDFRLFPWYWSQTMSTWMTYCSCPHMYSKTTFSA